MYVNASTIITFGSLVAAIGALLGVIFKVHKWYLRQEQQNEEIKGLRDLHTADMRGVNEENALICYALSACLDGLQQLGCNHTVPDAKSKLDKYLNERAHKHKE